MNIKALRAQFASSRDKIKLHNSAFLNQVESDLDRAKHPADKRRVANKIKAHVKAIVDDKAGFKNEHQEIVDGWFAMIDVLDAEIAAAADGDRAAGINGSTAGGGWFIENSRGEREAVHVVNSTESVTDLPRNVRASADRPPLADYLRGIVAGARTPEIRAALSEGVDSAGGYSIPTEVLGEFIDRLRAATCFVQAGARTLMLDGAKTRIMRIASDPTATWRSENAAVNESEPTFDALDFAPKSLACLVKVSNELLDDSANAGDALVQALTAAMALKLDAACFFGAGTGNEPRGLDNLAGVPTITLGAGNGASPDWDMLIDGTYQLEVGNGGPATATVWHPRSKRSLHKLKDANGNYRARPQGYDQLPMLATTSFPIAETVGTSTDCSTVHMGNFPKAILGLRQELRIMRLDQTFAGNLQTGFLAYLRADVQFEQAAAFVKIKGVRP